MYVCMYVCIHASHLVGTLCGGDRLLCDSAACRGWSGVGLADGEDQQVGVGEQSAVHQDPWHIVMRWWKEMKIRENYMKMSFQFTWCGCGAVVLYVLSLLLGTGGNGLPVQGGSFFQSASKAPFSLGRISFVDLHALQKGEGIFGSVAHVDGSRVS